MFKKLMLTIALLGATLSQAGVGSLIIDFKTLSSMLENPSIVSESKYSAMQLLNSSFKAVDKKEATIGIRSAFMNGTDNSMGLFNIGFEGVLTRSGFNNATLIVGASSISKKFGGIKAEEDFAKLVETTLAETRKSLGLETASYSRKRIANNGDIIDTNLVTMSMGNMNAEQSEVIIKAVTELRNRVELEGIEAVKKSMKKPTASDNSSNW